MINFELVCVVVCCIFFINAQDKKSSTGSDEFSSKIMFPNDFSLFNFNRRHSYADSRRQTHTSNMKNTAEQLDADFIDEDYPGIDQYHSNSTENGIPLDFIQDINKYNVSDLLLNFVEGENMEYDDEPFIKSRFGGGDDYEARSAAIIPKPAGCTPELKTITLATSDDPSILYIPQCTKVERCGGCCSHNLLSCQPKEVETLTYQVVKTQYTGGKKLKLIGKEVVVVEKHVKCKCDCKIKEEHCNKYQEYKPSECRCTCTNTDEEKKCDKSVSKKLWNSELCACQCRELLQCSTGFYFDQIECKCVPNPKRRFASNGRGYDPDSLIVTPLSTEN